MRERMRRCELLASIILAGGLSAAIGAAPAPRAGILKLYPGQTNITFTLPGSLHTTRGKFRLERGEIRFDAASGRADGKLIVDANSGDSNEPARDSRMKNDVLATRLYPAITFVPRKLAGHLDADGEFAGKITGFMEIHGADHQIAADFSGKLIGGNVAAACHFTVPYVAWGLKDPSFLFLSVAKSVDVEIKALGHVTWTGPDEAFAGGLHAPTGQ